MPTGTVKFFNEHKGYGFIQPDDGGNDAFVHISAVERAGFRSLRQDQRVVYELEEDRRGKMAATNLRSADEAQSSEAPAEAADAADEAPAAEAAGEAESDSAQ
jgi:CspA family cold shock protein